MFINQLWLKVLYACLCIFWFVRIQKGSPWVLILLMLVFHMLGYQNIQKPTSDVWKVQEIRKSYVIAQHERDKVILYHVDSVSLDDVIRIQGNWERIHSNHNFYGFLFDRWAGRQGMHFSMYVKQYRVLDNASSLRASLYRRTNTLPQTMRNMVKQALYGIQEEEVTLPYMVSSSGMHISFLCRSLEKLLQYWLSPFWAFTLSLAGMAVIGKVTVFSLALKRILIFRVVYYLMKKQSVHDRLGVSVLLFLCLFPHGYQELCLVLPVLFHLSGIFFHHVSKRLSSILILLPVQLLYFYECDLIQLISFHFQRILFALHYLSAWVSVLTGQDIGLTFTYGILLWLQHLPVIAILGYPSLLWLCLWIIQSLKLLQLPGKHGAVNLICLLVIQQYQLFLNPLGEVMFLDIGQGDTALITLPFGQGTFLMDVAGHHTRNLPEQIVLPILKAKGIQHLDAVILSHDDFDHSGGLKQLETLIPIHRIIREKKESVRIGNLEMKNLLYDQEYSDKNENSLIFYFELGGLCYLFTGDAGRTAEQKIMRQYPKLTADILKAGHHGSRTSSDPAFLHQLHPMLAVLSSGYHNRYGHPHQETLDTLNRQQISYRNTAESGAVSILFFKNLNLFRTASHEFDIITTR